MLHELVMCLLGNVGGLFQLKLENNKTKIKLVDNLEYLHPAEVEICNKLAELGNMYRKICEFYDNYAHGKSFANKSLKTGLYLHSFCDALNTVILSPYRETISQLERDLLKDNYHNVTYLQSHLENHFIIFYSANNLIDEIMLKNLHGCQIIDLVYKYTISGNTIVKETFIKILTINNEVMYKQLRDWMIYGHLNDKYDEFFISLDKILNDTTMTVESADKNGTATSKTQDEEGFFMSNEMEDLFLGHRFSSRYSQYCLNCTRLPSFINLKTANKILFAGELLQLFKSKSLNEIYSTSAHTNETSQIASATSSFHFSLNLSVNKVQHIADSNKYLNEEFNLINKKMDVFSKKIVNISRDEFSIINFDNLINEIRNYVSESVWHLIVEKYKLLDEFQRLKDMYLIGRGELFATFLESSNQLLNKQVDANFEYNINYIFQKSISRMLLDNESWLNKFRIIVNDENQLNVRKSNVNNGWSKIGLNYRVEWPFHSLITPKVLKKYNEIFNYLLSIRRVQIELNECFLFQMRLDVKKKSKISSNVWLTRNHMSFLIDNLQFYLQADVLETQFSELEENIKASKDFEQIRYAHDTFLTKIQYQSFILNKIVSNSLNEIMETCLLFSTFVKSFEDMANLEKNGERLNDIIKKFQTQTQTLYKTFKTLEKKQLGSHLEQLLTRINFNNYLEEHQGL